MNDPNQKAISVPFLGFQDTVTALNCSRSFLYALIEEKVITPKYIKSKPYFLIEDIMKAMQSMPY